MTARKRSRRLPAFQAASAFDRFAETHDLADYWDEFEEVDEPVELARPLAREIDRRARRKQLISLRIETWQLRVAKAEAARRGTPYHAVLRDWISQGMRAGGAGGR